MKAIKSEEEVNRVTGKENVKGKKNRDRKNERKEKTEEDTSRKPSSYQSPPTRRCKFCTQTHIMKKEVCPAWGKRCTACGLKNHFAASQECKKKKVHAVQPDYSSDSSSSLVSSISTVTTSDHASINSGQSDHQPIYCEMEVNGKPVKLQVDCGATVNILPKRHLHDLPLRPETVKLQMWNGSTIQALGRCKLRTRNVKTGQKLNVEFVIVKEELTPLLSRNAAEKMGLITVNYNHFKHVNAVTTSLEALYHKKFPEAFRGNTGILPGKKVHLTTMPNAVPVVRDARTLPESRKAAVKAELERLTESGVLVPLDEPTDWVSQMSVAKKKSGIRICIDPRPLNEVLMRERYKLPVLEDVLPELTGAQKFSVCDLKAGYLHCELDDESSILTTFATPFGRYRWLQLPFGLKVSSEIFQKRFHKLWRAYPAFDALQIM